MSKSKKMRIGGLRRRWIFNTILPVLALLISVVVIATLGISSYYYSGLQQGLENRAKSTAEAFASYFMTSYTQYYQMAVSYTDTFEDRDQIELQFINNSGQILLSSSGLTAGLSPGTSDIANVIATGEMDTFRGQDPSTGEDILSVSYPLYFHGQLVGMMRYATGLEGVNQQIAQGVWIMIAIAFVCLLLIIVTNLVFINSVVKPVAVVSGAANRIASGSYGVQLENPYVDELAELVENINQMSLKIGQNEKMKSEFISSVSHELRTPLTAINGWSETMLEDENATKKELRRGMHIILKESRRLTSMVEELLDFTRIEDGRFTLRLETMDLQAELEDAVFTYRELFKQEGIELHYDDNDSQLPFISGDPERLKQVFCNVLDNAAKHGGGGKRIDVSVRQAGSYARIDIRDYGAGVPEAELPFVKQKFYKGSSKARGSGIGLAVCEEIITRHNGSFTIANAEGGGAVARIYLPLEQ
ncbi:HAMP domain-containing sensor histidine kinase [Bengtsoniella intestinalis]|uniref:sensor histidine kinase n=1 Tax=Bengtsoniella intestinalis TaxID=3073143 RepID=UPI00391F0ECE